MREGGYMYDKQIILIVLCAVCLTIGTVVYVIKPDMRTSSADTKILYKLVQIFVGLLLLCVEVLGIVFYTVAIKNEASVTGGCVTDKTTVYRPATYFRTGQTEYVLYVDGEYIDNLGKTKTYAKKFFVDRETYDEYAIGDYYDTKATVTVSNAYQNAQK